VKTLEIYCDGSASDSKLLGCGIVFVSEGKILNKFSYKLPVSGDSYIAEYIAVIYAVYMINFYVENIYIYTDTPSIIMSYFGTIVESKNKYSKKLSELLRQCVDNLNCKHFRLKYVKYHANNSFHNEADILARKSIGL
jgi:ribonuclease HI